MKELSFCESTVVGWQTAGTIISIIQSTVAIAIIITSIPLFTNVIMNTKEVNLSKAFISTLKKIAAGMIVFFVPVIIPRLIEMLRPEHEIENYYSCEICLEQPSSSKCATEIEKYKNARKKDNLEN